MSSRRVNGYSPPMRIALIAPPFESVPPRLYGGTERVVAQLCRGLQRAGAQVTLFATADSSVECDLVPIAPEAFRLSAHPPADLVPWHLRALDLVARKAGEFDVIHNHNDYWMLPLAGMTHVPVVTTLHGRLDLGDIPHAFRAFKRNRFVSISDAQRLPLPDLTWVRTIHHGMELGNLAFHEKPGKYLAFLGRIGDQKRPDWAIEVAKLSGIPLKIAAKIEGAGAQEYFDARVKPHVDGRFIEFVGEIGEDEKSEFLGNALALVFPIDWPEPFGLVMIEALACGTPVLARPCGSVPELLRDGVTGFISSQLGELARRARDNMESFDRRGCRKWVEDRFSLERMTEEYLDVYRDLRRAAKAGGERFAGRSRAYRDRWDLIHPVERAADGDSEDQFQG